MNRPVNDNSLVAGMEIAMPPEELVKNVARLLALGLAHSRPSCVDVEKINAEELYPLATYVIAGFVGMNAASNRKN
jgi:hypothetical protein